MKKLNILFLGGAKRVTLAERFIEAGNELKYLVNVYTYELDIIAPFSLVGDVILGKKWSDKDIYVDLIKLIKEKNVSIVLANVDHATIVLAKLKEKLPKLNIISSNLNTSKIFLDKILLHKHCVKKGIKSIPLSKNQYPIFIKPRMGSGSKGTFKAINKKCKEYFVDQIDENEFIFQKYIDGIEYTVDAYVSKNGEFVGAIPRIRVNVISGESTRATIIHDDQIIEQTKFILASFNVIGPSCLQFIRRGDELFFLELNPRFGGGVIASIESGFNIPAIMIKDTLHLKFDKLKQYNNLIMTRCYREAFHAVNS